MRMYTFFLGIQTLYIDFRSHSIINSCFFFFFFSFFLATRSMRGIKSDLVGFRRVIIHFVQTECDLNGMKGGGREKKKKGERKSHFKSPISLLSHPL